MCIRDRGEGTRRWDLIRSGKFVEKALAVRAEMTEMVNDLQTKGYQCKAGCRPAYS